jgi:hypothetical protein
MSAAPQPPAPPPPEQPDSHYYRAILHELLELGTDLARNVHRQATQQAAAPPQEPAEPPQPPPDPTIPFDRIARCIRRTILLAQHLDTPIRPAAQPGPPRTLLRRKIIRDVEDEIARVAEGAEQADSLRAELCERLDDTELDEDLAHRPIAEVTEDLRRDLGLADAGGSRFWKRRTPEDIAALNALAARRRGAPRDPQTPTPPRARLHPAATDPSHPDWPQEPSPQEPWPPEPHSPHHPQEAHPQQAHPQTPAGPGPRDHLPATSRPGNLRLAHPPASRPPGPHHPARASPDISALDDAALASILRGII